MKSGRFITGEFYHIYNRGVEKRNIFSDKSDWTRFLQSMNEFNTIQPTGSLYERALDIKLGRAVTRSKLVDIICYCLNPNHYHFLLQQKEVGGISEFMKRLGGGYTKYFNKKYRRSGVLFQGIFKSRHVNSNEYLLRLSAYINHNQRVHKLGHTVSLSSWNEYIDTTKTRSLCNKKIILDQFSNVREYKNFTEEALILILEKKNLSQELASLLLE